jgi:hypothetical protein
MSRWRLATIRSNYNEMTARYMHSISELERDKRELKRHIELQEEELVYNKGMYDYEVKALEDKSLESINFLKREIDKQLEVLDQTIKQYEEKIVSVKAEYEEIIRLLKIEMGMCLFLFHLHNKIY